MTQAQVGVCIGSPACDTHPLVGIMGGDQGEDGVSGACSHEMLIGVEGG